MKFTTDAKWLRRKLAMANDSAVEAGGTSHEELKQMLDRRTITPATIAAAPTELGKVVRFVRERKGLSRTDLADIAKINESEIEAIETRSDVDPSPRALIYLADALELSKGRLKELAGFVKSHSVPANEIQMQFAARSKRIDAVSDDEYEAIRALVEVLSDKH